MRQQLVGFLPTVMALIVIAVMLQAHAPRSPLSYETVMTAVKHLGFSGIAIIAGLALAVSVSLQPLQFRLVQLLEGYWSLRLFSWLFRVGVWRQRRLRRKEESALTLITGSIPQQKRRLLEEHMQTAEQTLKTRFPAENRLLPTSLGNALRCGEDRVGLRYGMDVIVLWPRLYPLLPRDYVRDFEDEVTQLDVSVRLSVTWAIAALAALSILLLQPTSLGRNPGWLLIVPALLALCIICYNGAVESAVAHSQDIEVTLDLYRNLIVDAMHLPAPANLTEERQIFSRLCELFEIYNEAHTFDLEYQKRRKARL